MTRSGIVPRIAQSWWAPGRVVASLRGTPERVLIVILIGIEIVGLITGQHETPSDAQETM